MVYVPVLAGILTGGPAKARSALLVLAITALFFGRESLLALWRARRRHSPVPRTLGGALVLGAAALGSGAVLVVRYQLWGLVPLALAALTIMGLTLKAVACGEYRTIKNELAGIAGLCLGGPAAHYVCSGAWRVQAVWLWIWCTLFFWSSVFYVRLRVLSAGSKQADFQRVRRWSALYHGILALAVLAGFFTGVLPFPGALAFLPILARAGLGLVIRPRQLALLRVGLLEILYSLLFLTGISVALT